MPTLAIIVLWGAGMRPAYGAVATPVDADGRPLVWVDKRRVMLLVMLLESFAPSAVNGGVICTLHGYFPERHGKMLAVQYATCALPLVVWIFVGLWFIGGQ